MLWKVFCVFSLYSWQRGPNPPNLWRPPILPTPPFFSSFVQPLPPFLSLPTLDPTALFVALFLVLFWLNGWSLHIWLAILLNDIMDIHISSLGTFVPEGRWCVFYATRRQVYWRLTHNKILCWYSDLISHTQTHTRTKTHNTLRGQWLQTHTNPYVHQLLYAHSSYLSYTEWIIHWYRKFTFHNVFSFKKLFTCKCHISVD